MIVGLSPVMIYIIERKLLGTLPSTTTVSDIVDEYTSLPFETKKKFIEKARVSKVRIHIPRCSSPFLYFLMKHPGSSCTDYLNLSAQESKEYILNSYSEEYSTQVHFGYAMADEYIKAIHYRRMFDAMRNHISINNPTLGEKSIHSLTEGELSFTLGKLTPDDIEVYNSINDLVRKMYFEVYTSFKKMKISKLRVPAGFVVDV